MEANYKAKILLVEDDKNHGFIVKDYLEQQNYFVDLQENGLAGLNALKKTIFDICILDIMMPIKDGFTLAQEIRNENSEIPIIFLSAKILEKDRIKAFKIGADDYITKPFSTEELSLRIEAILKRLKKIENSNSIFNIGEYVFDAQNHTLKFENETKNLTKTETSVLKLLYENKNQVLKREYLLEKIWGENDYFKGRSMDVYITKLRKYLNMDNKINIINIHGTGFKFVVE
jgi:DNA-binding response OmpR family regulator